MRQDPPFAIQIEPTEGCTLACSFCALQSIRDNGADAIAGIHGDGKGPYKFMTVETADRIAKEVASLAPQGWNPRFEFAMHGEPTINPKLTEIVMVMRHYLPRSSFMLTTNGSGIMSPARLLALFDAGINTIAIDDYKHAEFVERMRVWLDKDWLKRQGIDAFRYPAQKHKGSPHERYTGKRVIVIADIADNTDGTHKLTNQGGNSGEADPVQKRCAKPFRELSIRWDGSVAICCDDWPGDYKIANVNQTPIDWIWQNEKFVAARNALYHGRRDLIKPCSGCNVVTYRNGLLPDKMGKQKLPLPSDKDRMVIALAQRGQPLTPRVKK